MTTITRIADLQHRRMVLAANLTQIAAREETRLSIYSAQRVAETISLLGKRPLAPLYREQLTARTLRVVADEARRLRQLAHDLPLQADVRTLDERAWEGLGRFVQAFIATPPPLKLDSDTHGWLVILFVAFCGVGWWQEYHPGFPWAHSGLQLLGVVGLVLVANRAQRIGLLIVTVLLVAFVIAGPMAAELTGLTLVAAALSWVLFNRPIPPQDQLRSATAGAMHQIDWICEEVLHAQAQHLRTLRRRKRRA
jgi:hypothetical protein